MVSPSFSVFSDILYAFIILFLFICCQSIFLDFFQILTNIFVIKQTKATVFNTIAFITILTFYMIFITYPATYQHRLFSSQANIHHPAIHTPTSLNILPVRKQRPFGHVFPSVPTLSRGKAGCGQGAFPLRPFFNAKNPRSHTAPGVLILSFIMQASKY